MSDSVHPSSESQNVYPRLSFPEETPVHGPLTLDDGFLGAPFTAEELIEIINRNCAVDDVRYAV